MYIYQKSQKNICSFQMFVCFLFLSLNCSDVAHPLVTSLMEWWLCAQWEALHMSASQRMQEVLWSVLSVIAFRAAYEGFHFYCLGAGGGIIAPHCTGGSRGWRLAAAEGPIDYWPGVKFYPACFSLPVPDPLLPREMGCHCFPTRGREGKGWDGMLGERGSNLVFYCPKSPFLADF